MLINALQAIDNETTGLTMARLASRLGCTLSTAEGVARQIEINGWAEDCGGFLLLTTEGEAQVRKTSAHVPRFFRTDDEPPPMSPRDLSVWRHIAGSPGAKPKDIARALDISAGAARQRLHALRKAGHIEADEEGGHHVTRKTREAQLREIRDSMADLVGRLSSLLK